MLIMKTLVIPLDSRPYNYSFLEALAKMDSDVNLTLPDKKLLGFKKKPANLDELSNFLLRNVNNMDNIVISLDMFIYGGLLPSRVHDIDIVNLKTRLDLLKDIKNKNPNIKIYASSLILRTPKYNSSEEEPDYYKSQGENIFKYGYFSDKKERFKLNNQEEKEFSSISSKIDKASLNDFLLRRYKNIEVIKYAISMVEDGIFEQLTIPQDDASEFGYTAIDQSSIYQTIENCSCRERIFLHPGTDESGCTLLTKAYLDYLGKSFNIGYLWSNEDFKNVIPNYEDRPFSHSLRSHILAAGATHNIDNKQVDGYLAINGCGEVMQEAFEVSHGFCVFTNKKNKPYKNITYYRYRDLPSFVKEIKNHTKNRHVVVADLSLSNGGETELVKLMDQYSCLDKISGYAAWNTTCNSLGTSIATLVFSTLGNNKKAIKDFLIERLISDWVYQTEIRFDVQLNFLPSIGASYSEFGTNEELILSKITESVNSYWHNNICNSFSNEKITVNNTKAPFKRLSGLEFNISI